MNCKNCSKELVYRNGIFICEHCNNEFLEKDIFPYDNDGSHFVTRGGVLIKYLGNSEYVKIPTSIIEIGESAFNSNLTIREVIFNNNLKCIQKNAFFRCSNLTHIYNYDNVEAFKDECFAFSGLESVSIGENVKEIGKQAFSNMMNLKKVIYAPKKNLKLNNTFLKCSSLKEVIMDQHYFLPSFKDRLSSKNNANEPRATLGDAFRFTQYLSELTEHIMSKYKKGICYQCGGKLRKSIFHAKCSECGTEYKY